MNGGIEKMEKAKRYSVEHGVDIRAIELDVQDQGSTDAAVAQVIEEQGRIDVLIHNAGHMSFGPAEAFMPAQLAPAGATPFRLADRQLLIVA